MRSHIFPTDALVRMSGGVTRVGVVQAWWCKGGHGVVRGSRKGPEDCHIVRTRPTPRRTLSLKPNSSLAGFNPKGPQAFPRRCSCPWLPAGLVVGQVRRHPWERLLECVVHLWHFFTVSVCSGQLDVSTRPPDGCGFSVRSRGRSSGQDCSSFSEQMRLEYLRANSFPVASSTRPGPSWTLSLQIPLSHCCLES